MYVLLTSALISCALRDRFTMHSKSIDVVHMSSAVTFVEIKMSKFHVSSVLLLMMMMMMMISFSYVLQALLFMSTALAPLQQLLIF